MVELAIPDIVQVAAGDWLTTLAPATRFILQGDSSARAAASAALGLSPEEAPCRARTQGDYSALWLGPDEFLLLAPAAGHDSLAARLGSALAGLPHSLVDVSQRQLGLAVHGRHASALLETGCPLDLEARAFPPGMCTRTVFGKSEIVLWRLDADRFHVEVWRSFAGYVSRYLMEAAQDFDET